VSKLYWIVPSFYRSPTLKDSTSAFFKRVSVRGEIISIDFFVQDPRSNIFLSTILLLYFADVCRINTLSTHFARLDWKKCFKFKIWKRL